MLTLEELTKRLKRDEEIKQHLDKERETIRIRLYRYKRLIEALKEMGEDLNEQE
jgi:hypothetical protein